MTDTPWSPSSAGVEAAAKKINTLSTVDVDCGGIANARSVAYAVMQDLHARGWRDASEVESVTYLRTRLDTLTAAHDRVIAERDALAARVKEAEADRDRAEAKLMEAAETMDRDGARAARLAAERDALRDQLRSFAIRVRGSDVPHKLGIAADIIVDSMDRVILAADTAE